MQLLDIVSSKIMPMCMNFPSFPGTYLDAHAVKDIFIWKSSKNIDFFQSHLLSLSATVLKMDATFNEAKCIKHDGPAVDNRFNV